MSALIDISNAKHILCVGYDQLYRTWEGIT